MQSVTGNMCFYFVQMSIRAVILWQSTFQIVIYYTVSRAFCICKSFALFLQHTNTDYNHSTLQFPWVSTCQTYPHILTPSHLYLHEYYHCTAPNLSFHVTPCYIALSARLSEKLRNLVGSNPDGEGGVNQWHRTDGRTDSACRCIAQWNDLMLWNMYLWSKCCHSDKHLSACGEHSITCFGD